MNEKRYKLCVLRLPAHIIQFKYDMTRFCAAADIRKGFFFWKLAATSAS